MEIIVKEMAQMPMITHCRLTDCELAEICKICLSDFGRDGK